MSGYVYEERPLTTYVANQLDLRMSRYHDNNFFVICDLKTGYGKTYISLKAIANVYPNANILVFTVAKQVTAKHWEQSVAAFNQATGSNLRLVSYSYGSLARKDKQAELMQQLANMPQPRFIILDECQMIKNAKSSSFRHLRTLLKHNQVNRVLGLSATPVGNHVTDMFSYFILNGFATSYTDMVNRYCLKVEPRFHRVVSQRDVDGKLDWQATFNNGLQLQKAYQSFVYCLPASHKILPPYKRFYVDIKLTAAERKDYKALVKSWRNKLAVTLPSSNEEVAFDNWGQFASALNNFLGTSVSHKDTYVKRLFASSKRPQRPLLVFYRYNATLQHLTALFTKLHANVFAINGQMNTAQKKELNQHLDSKNGNDVILIQYAAGGAGLNIGNATTAVFYEACNSYIRFRQAEGRNIRAYTNDTIYQVILRTQKTYESEVYEHVIGRAVKFNKKLEAELLQREIEQNGDDDNDD